LKIKKLYISYFLTGSVLFVSIYILYRNGAIIPFDKYVSSYIKHIQQQTISAIVIPLTHLNSPPALFSFTVALSIILFVRKLKIASLSLLVSIAATATMTTVAKNLIERARPTEKLVEISNRSFPSWHASTSMALAIALAWIFRGSRLSVVVMLWPLAIGLSRIYLNAHWASDVFAGWGLGLSVSSLTILIFIWIEAKISHRR